MSMTGYTALFKRSMLLMLYMDDYGAGEAIARASGRAYDEWNAQARKERMEMLKQHIRLLKEISALAQIDDVLYSYDDKTADIDAVYRCIQYIWRKWQSNTDPRAGSVVPVTLNETKYSDIVELSIYLVQKIADQRNVQNKKLTEENEILAEEIENVRAEYDDQKTTYEGILDDNDRTIKAQAREFKATMTGWTDANRALTLEVSRLEAQLLDLRGELAKYTEPRVVILEESMHNGLSASGALNTTLKL